MAKRKIIHIDRSLCNGCGDCITACAEGALALVDGLAQVVNEKFCDGFGDCLKGCPTGALTIEEREAEGFDLEATAAHVGRTGGEAAVERLQRAHRAHGERTGMFPVVGQPHGCPGSMQRSLERQQPARPCGAEVSERVLPSELTHWPIQIHLVNPHAPCFLEKELVVMATCAPIASPDVHWRFIRGRAVVVGCPKLDSTEGYVEKLASIFQIAKTPRVIVVRMEVPCCGGLTRIVSEAARISGRTDMTCEEARIGIQGDLQGTVML